MDILLVEDDKLLGQATQLRLGERQHQVHWIEHGAKTLSTIEAMHPEVVILDLSLPDIDGLTVLRQIRAKDLKIPVLILTARHTVEERIIGLDLGADDYLTKPFELDELEARLRAIHRRSHGRSHESIVYKNLEVNTSKRKIYNIGNSIEVSRREFDLLVYMLNNTGRVMTRGQIEAKLYADQDVGSNALEVHIHNLRKKLGKEMIKTVRGVGYYVEEA